MKRLILLISLVLFIMTAFSMPAVVGKKNKVPLRGVINNATLLLDLGILDDEGRLLVWSLVVRGDIDGYMVWWFDMPFAEPLINEDFIIDFYTCRWEIYDANPYPPDGSGGVVHNPDARILLAGRSAGETLYATDPVESSGLWDGTGRVTETSRKYRKWRNCVMYEGGPVDNSGNPGKIRIYPRGYRITRFFDGFEAEKKEKDYEIDDINVSNNYPNPFNPSTTIEFKLPETSFVKIDVYNNIGQKIKTLLNKEMIAGTHKVEWNAVGMASGIYYYKVQADGIQNMKRMILVK